MLLLASAVVLSAAPAARADDSQSEAALAEKLVELRSGSRVPALVHDPGLDEAARRHSAQMSSTHRLDHVGARGDGPVERVHEVGFDAVRVSENIVLADTVQQAFDAMVASPEHRTVAIDPGLTHFGVGVVGADDGLYVTFVFAERRPDRPRSPTMPPPFASSQTAAGTTQALAAPQAAPGGAPVVTVTRLPPPGADGRRVVGYWVSSHGRWWFYPLPADARPGQQLVPDAHVPPLPTSCTPRAATGRRGDVPDPGVSVR